MQRPFQCAQHTYHNKTCCRWLVCGNDGYFYPQIFGVGYDTISQVLENEIAFQHIIGPVDPENNCFFPDLALAAQEGPLYLPCSLALCLVGAYGSLSTVFFRGHVRARSLCTGWHGSCFPRDQPGTAYCNTCAVRTYKELWSGPSHYACMRVKQSCFKCPPSGIHFYRITAQARIYHKERQGSGHNGIIEVADAMKREVQTISMNKKVEALIALMQSVTMLGSRCWTQKAAVGYRDPERHQGQGKTGRT